MEEIKEMKHDQDCFLHEERNSIMSHLLILFGLVQILFGAVLPLGNSFSSASEEEKHENYMEIFFILQYLFCIVCIIYLIVIVHLDMKKRKKVKIREPKKNTTDHRDNAHDEMESRRCSSYENVNNADVLILMNQIDDESQIENSVDDGGTQMKDTADNVSHENKDEIDNGLRPKFRKFTHTIRKFSSAQYFARTYKHQHACDRIGLDAEGINLYLRMGAVAFGFGVLMHNALKFSDEVWTKGQCRGALWIPNLAVHFVYIFIQTYFLFKYHKIIFNTRKIIIRYMLVQLMVTNFCQWFKIVVFEITEELKHEAASLSGKHDAELGLTNLSFTSPLPTGRHLLGGDSTPIPSGNTTDPCVLGPNLSGKMSKFLFPCAIEYSLISGAVFYKLFTKVGHLRTGEIKEAHDHTMVTHMKYSTCHKSNKGFFFGLVLFLIVIGAVGLFFFLDNQADALGDHDLVIKIYMATELLLQIAALTSTSVAFFQVRSLPYRKHTNRSDFDDKLLFIGLSGIVSYDLFLFLPASESVKEFGWVSILYIAKAVIEICGCLFQTLFIMDGNRRCSASIEELDKKPGRSAVMFLFITNLAMWIVNTFEVEKAETSQIHLSHYHSLTWNIVTHLLLPLIIFFRFHSTVCLSEVWSSTYKMKETEE